MLPTNIGFGRVRMRALRGVADTPSNPGSQPTAVGATGSVKFVPAVSHVKNITGDEPVTIALPTIEATFDAEGYLVDADGNRWVDLIASDDTDNNPHGWTYRVIPAITGVPLPAFDMAVPEGADIDLTLASPVPSSPGIGQAAMEALVLRAESAAQAAAEAVEGAILAINVNGVEYTADENGVVMLSITGGVDEQVVTQIVDSYVTENAEMLRGPQGLQGPQGDPGEPGNDGREVQLQKTATHVQWRYAGDETWNDLVALSEITGPAGADGDPGTDGVDGREVELQTTETHIQWRYVGGTWTNLVALSAITGPEGPQGEEGPPGATTIEGISGLQEALDSKAVVVGLGGLVVSGRVVVAPDAATYAGNGQAGDLVGLLEV